jgi:hypothetical protein
MKTLFHITLVALCCAMTAYADDVVTPDTVTSAPGITIETSVDRAEIYIGDLINYRLSIIYDSGLILTPPPVGANLGAFDVKDYKVDDEVRLEDGRVKLESRFRLTTFTTGDYVIPPIPVEFMLPDSTRKILISEPVPIKVRSLLADAADTADIRDIKGPFDFKAGLSLWYYLIGGAVLLGLVGFYIWWRIRRKRSGPSEPIDTRDPWEIAFEDLAVLKEKHYPASGEFKQFYVELSEIIRAYLQRIYEIPVLDMTTCEFLSAIIEKDFSEELYNRLKGFLEFSDLVKFAKLIPEPDKVESDYEEAVDLVEHVRQIELSGRVVPVTGTAGAASGGSDV